MEFPPITIVMTTFFLPGERGVLRRISANRTLRSWGAYLDYQNKVNLHIADDGSDFPLASNWLGVTHSVQYRQGVGASLNKGFAKAFETSPLVLYAVDDWALTQDFDLTPWVEMLLQREDIGMVRLGPPHPNLTGRVEMLSGNWEGWGLVLDRQGFAFGTRPALFHKRFIDAYGWFAENTSAVEVERIYNESFCTTPGPNIVLALPHPWEHIGPESLSDLEPVK